MSEDLKILSEELKKARETNNITLQSIFKRTRIDIKFLKALEEGNFDIIDEVFIKAFLKEYALSVGLNSDEIIKKYELAKHGKLRDFNPSENETKIDEKPKTQKKVFVSPDLENPIQNFNMQNSKQLLVVVVGISFLVIIALLYLLFIKNRDAIIVQERPFDEIQEEVANNDDKARFDYSANDSLGLSNQSAGKLKLQIKAISKVWMRIVIDKENQDEFFIQKDSVKTLNAFHNFSILVGDAGAVQFVLNGKPLNFTAKRGEIKNVEIDSSGLKLLYLKKDELNQ